MTVGGRNLVILGVVSTVVAIATTGVSLAVYHNSGDIYLDRSRPGYLPDEAEIEEENIQEEEYEFDKSGAITKEVLEEYIENLEKEIDGIEAYEDPFNDDTLSDSKIGL